MNKATLVKRNLFYYRNAHIRTILGFAVSTAILVGSLIVGDSVRLSLRQMVIDRLGNTHWALESQDRFFTAALAEHMSNELNVTIAPALKSNGIVSISGGSRRANRVQVLGIDRRFSAIGSADDLYNRLPDTEVIVNPSMAENLSLKAGDEILLRIEKLDYIPRDVPMASDDDLSVTRRYRIKAVAGISQFGHFNLRISQAVPNTIFMSLDHLQSEMGLPGMANLLLIPDDDNQSLTSKCVTDALEHHWTLEDAGLQIRELENRSVIELRSSRIFLEQSVVDAARKSNFEQTPVLTYFVNALVSRERSTPYSFVSSPFPALTPWENKDDKILINRWLADDLKAVKGDSLSLRYYILGQQRTLVERTSTFSVLDIVPLTGEYADAKLMPDYPGLADQENCRDWNPGIPIDLDQIRPKDERYWDDYRGIPKAFVTLNAAQKMWGNRFGNLTAIRFRTDNREDLRQKLTAGLNPASLGYSIRPVREDGFKAGAESVDFSQLFIGLSFFIIIGALLLTALLVIFNLEQRSKENGLYLALGFSRKDTRTIIFSENVVDAILGGILGCILAVFYNQIVMAALGTVWRDIVGTSQIRMYIQIPTLLSGLLIGLIIAVITLWSLFRNQTRFSIRALQSGSSKVEAYRVHKRNWLSPLLGLLLLSTVFYILVTTSPGKSKDAAASFLMAASLLLTAGMLFVNYYLNQWQSRTTSGLRKITALGFSNAARNKTRSLTLVGLLASGLFIIFTVGSNQQGLQKDVMLRPSGTGGFTIFAESLLPVLHDLNSQKGQSFYGLDPERLNGSSVVPFRVREGDDASCLNLNRITVPRLIGVNPAELSRRKAFSLISRIEEVDPENPWQALSSTFGDGIIPGIADETVIIWGLGKSVGDTLLYTDEQGKLFRIKLMAGLANSVFQGNLIISETHFTEKYPSISGYRLFLVDTPPEKINAVSEELNWALQDLGFDAVSTARRLAEFNKVQNTYLSIFLILGGFGLILGTIGIGIIVLRNVSERRNELALMQSVGFSRNALQKLVLSEHGFLVLCGILLGLSASILAALPALLTPNAPVPLLTIALTLLIVTLNAGFWTWLATSSATAGDLIPALRNE